MSLSLPLDVRAFDDRQTAHKPSGQGIRERVFIFEHSECITIIPKKRFQFALDGLHMSPCRRAALPILSILSDEKEGTERKNGTSRLNLVVARW